jgi:hypothetical protein
MSEQTSAWVEQIKKIIADRAYTLNYDDGVQSRFMPARTEGGQHVIEVLLETTHMGHPFDLKWLVTCGDDASAPIRFEIVSPEGGVVWRETHRSVDKLRWDAQVIPTFIRGFFAGRASVADKPAEAPAAATEG